MLFCDIGVTHGEVLSVQIGVDFYKVNVTDAPQLEAFMQQVFDVWGLTCLMWLLIEILCIALVSMGCISGKD